MTWCHDDNLDETRICSISKSVSLLIQCTSATSGVPFQLLYCNATEHSLQNSFWAYFNKINDINENVIENVTIYT